MRVVVAGASGFVGRKLLKTLAQDHEVIALSRSKAQIEPATEQLKSIEWRSCDLFSLLEVEKALEGAEIGIYLVHSMIPSARLSQGSFDDFDLIVADNFVRAAEKHGLKQLIYLGGILPKSKNLSRHLESRHEVEKVFAHREIPVTVLRAAMIIGAEGSSFDIMIKLIERLPVLLLPSWTETLSQPVAIFDVVRSIVHCLQNPECFGQTYDLAGPDKVSYRQMMITAARALKLKRRFIHLPFIPPRLSRFWITVITGAPKNLIRPLIDSLRSPMVADPKRLLKIPNYEFASYSQAVDRALQERGAHKITPHAYLKTPQAANQVRSVQRLPLPEGWRAETVAQAYLRWLPRLIPWFLKVEVDQLMVYFWLRGVKWPLLILEHSPQRSRLDRQLLYIRGGLLTQRQERGRLEFREALEQQYILAAIHNFAPSLPWYIYTWSQAKVHLWVMRQFARYLAHKQKTGSRSLRTPTK